MNGILVVLGAILLAVLAVALGLYVIVYVKCRRAIPTNDRPWFATNWWLPHVTFDGNQAVVTGIRNFTLAQWKQWKTLPLDPSEPSPYHIDKTYDMDDCRQVWLGFSPFHVWMSFEFGGGKSGQFPDYLVVSTEHRHQFQDAPRPGLWNFLTNKFEVYSCLCTENDIFNRCLSQNPEAPHPLILFPVTDMHRECVDYERSLNRRKMLYYALKRANHVAANPESYNYLFNCCATNTAKLGKMALELREELPGFWYGFLVFLRYRERGMLHALYDLNVINSASVKGATFEEVREFGNVTGKLMELTNRGVAGNELSWRVRERFRSVGEQTRSAA